MSTNRPVKVLLKFHSDTNFALFVEQLDFFIPGNLYEADYAKAQVKVFTDVEIDQALRLASDLGATVYE